jgi:hypothetical protein
MDVIFTPEGPREVSGVCYHNIVADVEPRLKNLLRLLVAEGDLQGRRIRDVISTYETDDRYFSLTLMEKGQKHSAFMPIGKRLVGLKYQFMTQRGALDWPIESILDDPKPPTQFIDAPFEDIKLPKGWKLIDSFYSIRRGQEHQKHVRG